MSKHTPHYTPTARRTPIPDKEKRGSPKVFSEGGENRAFRSIFQPYWGKNAATWMGMGQPFPARHGFHSCPGTAADAGKGSEGKAAEGKTFRKKLRKGTENGEARQIAACLAPMQPETIGTAMMSEKLGAAWSQRATKTGKARGRHHGCLPTTPASHRASDLSVRQRATPEIHELRRWLAVGWQIAKV